jgi:hypothetical protein
VLYNIAAVSASGVGNLRAIDAVRFQLANAHIGIPALGLGHEVRCNLLLDYPGAHFYSIVSGLDQEQLWNRSAQAGGAPGESVSVAGDQSRSGSVAF